MHDERIGKVGENLINGWNDVSLKTDLASVGFTVKLCS